MKSLFSKSISDACAIDELTPETVRSHINTLFLSQSLIVTKHAKLSPYRYQLDRTMAPTNAEKYVGFILLKMITNERQQRLGS